MTINDLQRALLKICQTPSAVREWAKVAGMPVDQRIDWAGDSERARKVSEIRNQIRQLNPNAALYYGWAPGDSDDLRISDDLWFWLKYVAGSFPQ